MHRLFLLRHAKSDWSVAGQPDFERPLNARGVAAARLMGDYMARHDLVPDGVICSPSRRTMETWAAIAPHFPPGIGCAAEPALYAAAPQIIASLIRAAGGEARALLCIAHNPGIQAVAEGLIATGDVALRERLREKFPTAALAVIDFKIDAWDQLHEPCGRLVRFITPRAIAAATN